MKCLDSTREGVKVWILWLHYIWNRIHNGSYTINKTAHSIHFQQKTIQGSRIYLNIMALCKYRNNYQPFNTNFNFKTEKELCMIRNKTFNLPLALTVWRGGDKPRSCKRFFFFFFFFSSLLRVNCSHK